MFVAGDGASVGVHQVEGQAAELGALAPVGTAAEAGLADVALPAVTDAERSVHEDFERRLRAGLVDAGDVVQREFARQHHLAEACFAQETHFLHRPVVHLRAGVQGDGGQVEAGDAHVLYDECVYACLPELVNQLFGRGELVVAQQRVDGGVDADIVGVRIVYEPGYVFY